jgi:hypothetical protein
MNQRALLTHTSPQIQSRYDLFVGAEATGLHPPLRPHRCRHIPLHQAAGCSRPESSPRRLHQANTDPTLTPWRAHRKV